jgi:hypothetical protein
MIDDCSELQTMQEPKLDLAQTIKDWPPRLNWAFLRSVMQFCNFRSELRQLPEGPRDLEKPLWVRSMTRLTDSPWPMEVDRSNTKTSV